MKYEDGKIGMRLRITNTDEDCNNNFADVFKVGDIVTITCLSSCNSFGIAEGKERLHEFYPSLVTCWGVFPEQVEPIKEE